MIFGAGVVLLAACGQSEKPAPIAPDVLQALNWEQLQPLASKFAYGEGVRTFCDDTREKPLTEFMAEIEGQNLPDGLFTQIKTQTDVIMNSFNDASKEYVCTPEMYEQTGDGILDAAREWTAIKAGTVN
jgi:hypothetical protein